MNKWLLIVGAFILVIILGFYARSQGNQSNNTTSPTPTQVTNFEECAAAGYPVQESYPARCTTPDGQSFTQEIGNEMGHSDVIQISSPRPNEVVTSPLMITGEARGSWYFEATFPFQLVDDNGLTLATGFATATGEWMTEEFVPFSGEIAFATPTTPTGKLLINNANPSGLPENEKELIIPVRFAN